MASRRAAATPMKGPLTALLTLVARSRRRYGGYIVHVGIGLMFLGFAGRGWELEKEAVMAPGETVTVGNYSITYRGPRMEVDTEKRMIFADIDVAVGQNKVGSLSPAQFIYLKAQMPTTEVAMLHRLRDDLHTAGWQRQPANQEGHLSFSREPAGFVDLGGRADHDERGQGSRCGLKCPGAAWVHGAVCVWLASAASGIMVAVVIGTAPARAVGMLRSSAPTSELGAASSWHRYRRGKPGRRPEQGRASHDDLGPAVTGQMTLANVHLQVDNQRVGAPGAGHDELWCKPPREGKRPAPAIAWLLGGDLSDW